MSGFRGAADSDPTSIAVEHENILCYAKAKDRLPSLWRSQDHEAKTLLLKAYALQGRICIRPNDVAARCADREASISLLEVAAWFAQESGEELALQRAP